MRGGIVAGGITYGYDAAGSLRQKTDADGRYTFFGYFGYDASRRPTTISFDTDSWIYYQYDSLGNLLTVKDQTGTFTSDYDFLNRRVTKRTAAGNVYFQYDRTGLRTMSLGPDGGGTYHTYDAASRLVQASMFDPTISGAPRPTYFTLDASGMRTAKLSFPNSVFSYYANDNAGRTIVVNNVSPMATPTTVSYFFYGRDTNGNIISSSREAAQATATGQNI